MLNIVALPGRDCVLISTEPLSITLLPVCPVCLSVCLCWADTSNSWLREREAPKKRKEKKKLFADAVNPSLIFVSIFRVKQEWKVQTWLTPT